MEVAMVIVWSFIGLIVLAVLIWSFTGAVDPKDKSPIDPVPPEPSPPLVKRLPVALRKLKHKIKARKPKK